jgi:exopolysaccharide biosynthesis protein
MVSVDGRLKNISVGMTLNELADYMSDLGCVEAMNLDGGGSSTLWYDGKVQNRPCDGYERPVANSLVVLLKK